jgi:hypothetical protein
MCIFTYEANPEIIYKSRKSEDPTQNMAQKPSQGDYRVRACEGACKSKSSSLSSFIKINQWINPTYYR